MADVTACPFPVDFVLTRGAIQSLPPLYICFATEAPAHRFDDIARVGKHFYIARFAQRFEADGGGDNFRLLVRRAAEILADCAPKAFVTEQSNCRCATRCLAVAQTRSVAK